MQWHSLLHKTFIRLASLIITLDLIDNSKLIRRFPFNLQNSVYVCVSFIFVAPFNFVASFIFVASFNLHWGTLNIQTCISSLRAKSKDPPCVPVCDETQNLNDTDSETFFRYQNIPRPVPGLFSVPNFFETGSDTFFGTKIFRDRLRDFFR